MSNAAALDAPPAKADTNDRRTPRWFFDLCVARFGPFWCDLAANFENHLCGQWFGPGSLIEDALTSAWPTGGLCWLNPPYGPPGTIQRWIAKARLERDERGTRTLLLLPADTSTAWYQDVKRTELVEDVPFRLAFDAPNGSTKGNSAKFGSVLVYIAPRIQQPAQLRKSRLRGLF